MMPSRSRKLPQTIEIAEHLPDGEAAHLLRRPAEFLRQHDERLHQW